MGHAKGERNPNCSCSQSQQWIHNRIGLWCDAVKGKHEPCHEGHAINNGHAFQNHSQKDKPTGSYHAGKSTQGERRHAIIHRGGNFRALVGVPIAVACWLEAEETGAFNLLRVGQVPAFVVQRMTMAVLGRLVQGEGNSGAVYLVCGSVMSLWFVEPNKRTDQRDQINQIPATRHSPASLPPLPRWHGMRVRPQPTLRLSRLRF